MDLDLEREFTMLLEFCFFLFLTYLSRFHAVNCAIYLRL